MAINNLLQRRGRRPEGTSLDVHVARWPVVLAMIALGALYLVLPPRVVIGPRWLLLALEAPAMVFFTAVHRVSLPVGPRVVRLVALAFLGLATVFIAFSVEALITELVVGKGPTARALLAAAAGLWCANVLVFALWFWEVDGGGPHRRRQPNQPVLDFLFPQQSGPGIGPPGWSPSFADYLFVAFTNSTAFSPTDTLPLTVRVKLLMMIQSLTSLLMIAVLAARAINILQ